MMLQKTFKKLKWWLLAGVILLNIIAYNHAYQFTHFTKDDKKIIETENLSFDQKIRILFQGIKKSKPQNTSKPEQDYEIVDLQSHERLEAWLIKQENHKGIVLLFHGYGGSKSGLLSYSNYFHELGYSTFLLDFMGSGGSEGHQTTIGFKESRDVEVAIKWIKEQFPTDETILFGSSMGAVSIMKALSDRLVRSDKAILACPYGTMRKTVQNRFEILGVPSFPFADLLMFYGGIQNGFNAYRHNPRDYAKDIDIPTLLLLGKTDNRVSEEEINDIYDNLNGSKKLVLLSNSGHENYLNHDKEIWTKAIQQFLKISN